MTIKVINKTNQSFQLINQILHPRGFIIIKEKTEQIESLEKKGLVIVKVMDTK